MAKLSNFQGGNNFKSKEDVMSKFNEYKDLPQDQINQKLFEEVAKQKRDGTFDYRALENMLEAIKGNLSENDYQNVKRMLELLR
jgi:hypothetical protein